LIDEVRLQINPLILGGGKALFKDVKGRHGLELIQSKSLSSGKLSVAYRVRV
jgi:dihydrofolate reductase